MRQSVRSGLAALTAAALVPLAAAQQAATPGTRPAPAAGAAPGQAPAKPAAKGLRTRPPEFDQVLATVNGEKITRGEVVETLAAFVIPPGSEQRAYDAALDLLINTRLLTQFLRAQRVNVSPREVDAELGRLEERAKSQGASLADVIEQNGASLEAMREKILRALQWKAFVTARATPAELKRYADQNKDTFSGAQVRASHILVKVDPGAPAAEKEKARQKLLGIKRDIEAGKIRFADAANKYSEDDANVAQPAGGDLGLFPRRGQFIEPFAAAAFALPKGKVSDPVETEYGYHLILVTDRREGNPINLEQARDAVLNQYAADLQEQVVAQQRKTAKIDTKPMPADLFPKPPSDAPKADQPKGAATPKDATPKPSATR